MALTRAGLVAGLARIADHMETVADELNTLDGQLGDGDLGVTMVRGGREVKAILDDLPPEVGEALMKVAQAFTRVSGSSYGTLLATGLMAAAKATRGRTEVPWHEMSSLLGAALDQMRTRGKASLGDKTVLDALDAAVKATKGLDDPAEILAAARTAVAAAMATCRDWPARIGRARIFAEKSVGLDDPGQRAFLRILEGLG
ncbi:DAK2 domain-containing protein [Rhodovastum atsumiense]|uniref:DAK2 domain-containing protein n=1 Tax=Rhodovastum atsumiense TaxID=504468 RepID=A0A5M6IX59_9PROT|nr:DAK2 domain-containing protein [Rhodovastum atsumiense]KAA5611955.1 DAK2 domain-containing protein [Rhodovastum atsumiense]CAH2598728.1 DAK2 domain-containing protein [Rhodovastum atsumiense]